MPLDPATIRATAQRVVDEQELLTMDGGALREWWADHFGPADNPDLVGFAALRDAIVRATQPDLNAVKREAASKAWDAAAFCHNAQFDGARDRYLAREYPETRESLCMHCGEVYRGDEDHTTEDCIKYIAAEVKRLKSFAEAVR